MKRATVVVFHDNGVRILHGADPDQFKDVKNALINPVFPTTHAPHHWMIKDGKIAIRESEIPVDPSIPNTHITVQKALTTTHYLIFVASHLAAVCVGYFLKF